MPNQESCSGLPDHKEANVPKKTQARQTVPDDPESHPILKISYRKLTGFPTLTQIIGPGDLLSQGQSVGHPNGHSAKCRKLFWKAKVAPCRMKVKQVRGAMKVDKPLSVLASTSNWQ